MSRFSTFSGFCVVHCLLGLTLLSGVSHGQTVHLGVLGGGNLSTFQGDTQVLVENVDFSSLRRRASYQVGGFALFRINDRFALRSELFYVQKGAVLEGSNLGVPEVTGTYRFAYLQAPVLLEVLFPTGGTATAVVSLGANASYNTISGVEVDLPNETRTRNYAPITETFDFGGVIGAGFRYPFDNTLLTFDVRYNPGLSDIITSEGVSLRTDSIMLSLGYAFSL